MKQPRDKDAASATRKGASGSYEMQAGITDDKKQTKPITKEGDATMETKTVFGDFDPMHVSGNVMKMMRYSLDTTFENVTKVQEFYDKIFKEMIKTNLHIQGEAEKVVSALSESGKKSWDEYKKIVDKGFKQTEGIVTPAK